MHTADCMWAKDDRRCYDGGIWLRNADIESFKPLNYAYAMDKNHVFTVTGTIKNVDIASFQVLDTGKCFLRYNEIGIVEYTPTGYAKDKNYVYYDNYEGKTKIIKKADVETFTSFGDTYFARDKNHVYGNGKIIKKANSNTWTKFTQMPISLYSKDNCRVFYGFWEIDVDYETFEVLLPQKAKSINCQLAKDKNRFYRNGAKIRKGELEMLMN